MDKIEKIAFIEVVYKEDANEAAREQARVDLLENIGILCNDMVDNYHDYPLVAYGIEKINIRV